MLCISSEEVAQQNVTLVSLNEGYEDLKKQLLEEYETTKSKASAFGKRAVSKICAMEGFIKKIVHDAKVFTNVKYVQQPAYWQVQILEALFSS